jgi:hypothetical protein
MAFACQRGVPLRTRLARTFVGTAIVFSSLVAVGLTAPADGPFTIDVEPVFLRLDPVAIADPRARPDADRRHQVRHAPPALPMGSDSAGAATTKTRGTLI